MNTQTVGQQGEELVAQSLQKNGYEIVAHNYRQRCGEIDLIVRKKDRLAFVEVKMRRSRYFDLMTVITPSKQRKIIATAKHFLTRYPSDSFYCQFDVALVEPHNGEYIITYVPNAFTEVG